MRDLKTAVRTKRITVRLSPGELEELKRKEKLEGCVLHPKLPTDSRGKYPLITVQSIHQFWWESIHFLLDTGIGGDFTIMGGHFTVKAHHFWLWPITKAMSPLLSISEGGRHAKQEIRSLLLGFRKGPIKV